MSKKSTDAKKSGTAATTKAKKSRKIAIKELTEKDLKETTGGMMSAAGFIPVV